MVISISQEIVQFHHMLFYMADGASARIDKACVHLRAKVQCRNMAVYELRTVHALMSGQVWVFISRLLIGEVVTDLVPELFSLSSWNSETSYRCLAFPTNALSYSVDIVRSYFVGQAVLVPRDCPGSFTRTRLGLTDLQQRGRKESRGLI